MPTKPYLSQPDLKRLLETPASAKEKAMLACYFGGGLKVHELRGLEIKDLRLQDPHPSMLLPGHSGGFVQRAVPDTLKQTLEAYLAQERPGRWVFESGYLEPYTGRGIEKVFERMGRRAGLSVKVTPTLIRNTFIIKLIQYDSAKECICQMAGLRSPKALIPYYESCLITSIRPRNPLEELG
ncbi:MAG: tyrosine-type recombinase/integrase [Bacteroidia bacterium]|nr:tyrosine-type recombinase/integrase [Bacteroidia bacterium]